MKDKHHLLFLSLLTISGCTNLQVDCEGLTIDELKTEYIVIVKQLPIQKGRHYFIVEETDQYTNVDKTIIDPGRRWIQYKKNIEIGNTLIKRRGELTAYIHKKEQTLVFLWKCGGNEYQD
ncbi:hypothetical protein [Myroides odoratimimus]|uniref:hypothetical protein n=1 Tax=Myroides odoratimimus TaxID=76832 RepID=UPI000911A64D|nr:hypothetical protein [Myroides odoratimimus]SHL55430.1 hypothetical protein SAMN05444275_1055 [Myroides odoratimimus subsp. xuanwuensis]